MWLAILITTICLLVVFWPLLRRLNEFASSAMDTAAGTSLAGSKRLMDRTGYDVDTLIEHRKELSRILDSKA